MTAIHAKQALLPEGWVRDVRIKLAEGKICGIEREADAQPADERHNTVVPAIGNLHSHAFQRAMAGLAEIRGPGDDSFWSWRTLMYRFALRLSPAQLEAIAYGLYVEMLEAGYTAVCEFHYVHHQPDGQPYADDAELALAVLRAAGVDVAGAGRVGDRHHDVEGAAAHGVPTVFVTWGYGRDEEAAGAAAVARTADELLAALGVGDDA